MKVMIYDDEERVARRWAEHVSDACPIADVTVANQNDVSALLRVIHDRRSDWRKNPDRTFAHDPSPADEMDIIIVDYDLFEYSAAPALTGSRFAYLLRCFTRCGIIVILNQGGPKDFDLRLANPTADFGDIHVGDNQLRNPGLWDNVLGAFRPWYWPILSDMGDDYEQCVSDVEDNLDVPLVEFFRLGPLLDWLSSDAEEFLASSKPMESVTFTDLALSTSSGITLKDQVGTDQLPRVAAARARALLSSIVLPAQNLLVDAPHLVSRLPSVMTDQSGGIDAWNRLCLATNHQRDDALMSAKLQPYRFGPRHWLPRPAWFWPSIIRDETITEVKNPWTTASVPWVFCEDMSQFIPEEFALDVDALVSPPFTKRFLLDPYSSQALDFLNDKHLNDSQDPDGVVYVPQAWMSL